MPSAGVNSNTGSGIGSLLGSAAGPIGTMLGGMAGSALGGLFGKKESSGRNLGAKEDEFNQRAYYSYGITPYELISNGGAGKGGGIAQGEAMSARNHDAQMKMLAKEINLKAKELETAKRNTDVTSETAKEVAQINERASNYKADLEAGRVGLFGTGFNVENTIRYIKSLSDGVIEKEDVERFIEQAKKSETMSTEGQKNSKTKQALNYFIQSLFYPRGMNFGRGIQAF